MAKESGGRGCFIKTLDTHSFVVAMNSGITLVGGKGRTEAIILKIVCCEYFVFI